MPKMPLTSENKAKSQYDYNRLALDFGERARVVAIEKEPETAYVHTLKMPTLLNGQPIYETIKNKKGDDVKVMKTDFVGRHVCLGSVDVIADKGLDESGCPVCAESVRSSAVSPPERRFAMNVLRYKTKPGVFTIQDPFQAELVVWSFGDKILNVLIDKAEEWGDLNQKDLLLGPCTQKQFQTFDINIGRETEWLATPERKQMVKDIYKNNRVEDLMVAIGRGLTRDQVEDDLEKVMRNYNIANGKATAPPIGEIADQLDVSGLLEDEPEATPSKADPGDSGLGEFAQPEPDSGDQGGEKVDGAKKTADDELDLSDFLDL